MHIENFKGLRLFDIDFDNTLTRIVGANGTGKTTLHDAYMWLLTGADSSGNAAFFVQPLSSDNRTVDHLTTVVSCKMSIDGVGHEIKRKYEQKWTRRKGTEKDVLTGNTSDYFIDNVPMKMNEFYGELSKLLCKKEDFAMLSSIYAFDNLDTKTKRAKLVQMAGQLPELMNRNDYPRLYKYWETSKSVDSIKKTISFELAGFKDEKIKIPTRLTENERDLPQGVDFDALRAELEAKKGELATIDAHLQKKADGKSGAFAKVAELTSRLKDVETELSEIVGGVRNQRNKKAAELLQAKSNASLAVSEIESKIRIAENEIVSLRRQENSLRERLAAAREEWKKKNAETFSDTTLAKCPTCHHVFTEDERIEMRNSLINAFNAGKVGLLKAIADNGNRTAEDIKSVISQIKVKEAEVAALRAGLEEAKKDENDATQKFNMLPGVEYLLGINKEYQNVIDKKNSLKQSINAASPVEQPDEAALNASRQALSFEIEALIKKLALESNIEKINKRRAELEAEDAELSAKIANLDGVLYEIQKYTKAKINLVEDAVSSRFKYVRWKMYEPNLTNDGEKEICECLVDGVPVSNNVNTAGRINAGIDIINALAGWLELSVPLWVDGKESITDLLETDAQLITLEVREGAPLKTA